MKYLKKTKVDLVIIDEIGTMELISPVFKKIASDILRSSQKILGVIHQKDNPFSEKIRKMDTVDILEITYSNRDQMLHTIKDWLRRNLLL